MIIFYGFLAITLIFTLSAEDAIKCGSSAHENTTSCHILDINNDLPNADDKNFKFPENSIFFIESSCRGGLAFRQACAVESTARANPNRQVNVLFVGPVLRKCLDTRPISSLRRLKNVKLYRIHLNKVVADTPVANLISSGALSKSNFPVHHTSNILRYAILYKHGGIYLDLDVMVVKPFDWLPESKNFVGREDDHGLGSAVIGFAKTGIGNEIAYKTLRALTEMYNPLKWHFNSIHVLASALKKTCYTKDVDLMDYKRCRGLEIYNKTYFYPIPYTTWRFYFRPFVHSNLDNAFAFHLWNKMSKTQKIPKRSLYGFLIYTYCPLVNAANKPLKNV